MINRIRNMLMYVSAQEVFQTLTNEGVDSQTIFLAYCAAKRLNEVNN